MTAQLMGEIDAKICHCLVRPRWGARQRHWRQRSRSEWLLWGKPTKKVTAEAGLWMKGQAFQAERRRQRQGGVIFRAQSRRQGNPTGMCLEVVEGGGQAEEDLD